MDFSDKIDYEQILNKFVCIFRGQKTLGIDRPDELSKEDDEYEAYRKRMMLAYRFRPNPLVSTRMYQLVGGLSGLGWMHPTMDAMDQFRKYAFSVQTR